MKSRFLGIVFVVVFLCCDGGVSAVAQNRPGGPPGGPPSGPPPGNNGPGMNGPGVNNGQGNGAPSNPGARNSNPSANSGMQAELQGRWWDDKSIRQAVGLRKDQQKKMDAVFNANKAQILSTYNTYLDDQAKVDKLNKDKNVDKAQLFAAIDAVNQARAELQKAESQFLLEIRQEMDPDQLDKFDKLKHVE
jgi:hypothetical protein